MQVSVCLAPRLDGRIARAYGDRDWFARDERADSGEDDGSPAVMETGEILVLGRHLDEKVLPGGAWPYGEEPSPWVVYGNSADNSHHPKTG